MVSKLFFLLPVYLGTMLPNIALGQSIEAVVPVSTVNGTMVVMKQQAEVPDLESMLNDPNYVPKVYTKENITDIGWTPKAIQFLDSPPTSNETVTQPSNSTQICLNCDESSAKSTGPNPSKFRSVLAINMGVLNSCVDGWCRYKNTLCFFNVVCGAWYNCCPEDLKGIIVETVDNPPNSPATAKPTTPGPVGPTTPGPVGPTTPPPIEEPTPKFTNTAPIEITPVPPPEEFGGDGSKSSSSPSPATTSKPTSPSATSPSATSPSAKSPSATSPSATSPSATSPSATSPSATSPSATSPSATSPSATSPSATSPSATSPSSPSPSSPSPSSPSPSSPSPSSPSPSSPSPSSPSPSSPSPSSPSPSSPSPTSPSPSSPSPTSPSPTSPSPSSPSPSSPDSSASPSSPTLPSPSPSPSPSPTATCPAPGDDTCKPTFIYRPLEGFSNRLA